MSNNKHYKTEAKHTAEEPKEQKQGYYVHNSLVSYYLLVMFSFFTLFLTNQYSNARHDKFYLFLGLSGAMIIGTTLSFLLKKYDKSGDTLAPFFKPISVPDTAMLSFIGCAVISSLFSPHFADTIIAEIARNNGLLLLLTYAVVYFIITRMYVYKDYVLAVYLIFSWAVAILTLLNFFYIDPLELLKGYSEAVAKDFGSTIGNKNTIASYMSLFLPVAVMTFVINEKKYMRVLAGISIAVAYIGALSANSSSVILGLIIAIPVMAVFSARRYEYLMRFMLAMAILFAGGKLLRFFSFCLSDADKGFEFIQRFLIYDKLTYIPIAVFGVIFLLMLFFKGNAEARYPAKLLTVILTVLLASGVVGVIGAMLYFTLIDTKTSLGSFDKLLRFDDRWGTHRGFMWIRSMEEYGKFDISKKLFGYGPDMFYYVLEPYFTELSARFGDGSTDCAHNEYINYLVTQGLFGLLSYLALLGAVCVRSIKRAAKNPIPLIFVSAIVCYAVQATVNLYQPITTPVFFIFIAIAEAMNRQTPIDDYKTKHN